MQKKLFSILIICITVFLVFAFSACKKNDKTVANVAVSSSEKSQENSIEKSTSAEEIIPLDRKSYNTSNLIDSVKNLTVVEAVEGEALSTKLQGYLLGDVVGKSLGYVKCSDNYWHSFLNGKKANEVLNKFLNYKLDASEELTFTDYEIQVCKDKQIIDLLGYSNVIINSIKNGNTAISKLATTTFGDWLVVFGNDKNASLIKLSQITKQISVSEALLYFEFASELKIEATKELTISNLISISSTINALGDESGNALLFALYAKSDDLLSEFNKEYNCNGVSFSTKEIANIFFDLGNLDEKTIAKIDINKFTDTLKTLFLTLKQDNLSEIMPYCEQYVKNRFNEKIVDTLTVGETILKVAKSENKKQEMLAVLFDVVSELDEKFGENEISDSYSVSNALDEFNKIVANIDVSNLKTSQLDKAKLIDNVISVLNDTKANVVKAIEQINLKLNLCESEKLTFEQVINALESSKTSIVDESNINVSALKELTLNAIFNVSNKKFTGFSTIDNAIDACFSVSVYELINYNDNSLADAKSAIGAITIGDTIGAIQLLNSKYNQNK